MKKIIALFLAVLTLLSVSCAFAGCAPTGPRSREEIDGHIYTLNDDGETYSFSTLDPAFSGTELVIPQTITEAGYKVTAISYSAFRDNTTIEKITLPQGITVIDGFENCTALKSINIPMGVTTIESAAFSGCTSLTNIILPESVTTIGRDAFADCSALQSINLPSGVTVIEEGTFAGCASLTELPINSSVTTIKQAAFENCAKIERFVLPSSLVEIGYGAFCGCTALKEVSLPQGLTTMENGVFWSCPALKVLTIPGSVTSIGDIWDPLNLQTIHFGATKAQWFEASGTDEGSSRRFVIHCTDGSIEPTIVPID